MSDRLLSVADLQVQFRIRANRPFQRSHQFVAVDDVSFDIADGETLALVGESGSGKSTIGNAVLGLAPISAGSIRFRGKELAGSSKKERRAIAADLQVVFQNPYGSLNPSLTIESILTEPIRLNSSLTATESRRRARDLLERVGMPADSADRTPHSFSGGQRQRIAIARALAVSPRLIICDEPTSALDVSTQKVVLDLLRSLREETGVALLFITHDLAIVREFADRVIVLNRGRIVEQGLPVDVCDHPQDPYTQRLVAAAPVPDPILQASRRAARLTSSR